MAKIAQWKFNGNVNDQVNSYTLTGANITYLSGAAIFNGSSSYVYTSNAAFNITGAKSFTIHCKFSVINTSSTIQCMFGKWSGYGYNYLFYTQNGYLSFVIHYGSSFYSCDYAVSNLTTGKWYAITCVYSPSSYIRMYVDGKLAAENSTSIPASTTSNTSQPLYIGWSNDGGTYFNGAIGEIIFYNHALSVAAVMNEALQLKGFF